MTRILTTVIAALWAAGACLPAAADIVTLKNGRHLEGIVIDDGGSHIRLDLGAGIMTLPRDSIASIEAAAPGDNADIEKTWQDRFFLHRKYVPDGWQDTAADFIALMDARETAFSARREAARRTAEIHKVEKELEKLQSDHLGVSRKLAAAKPDSDPAAYNTLVAESNRLQALHAVKAGELLDLRKRLEPALDRVASYVHSLGPFQSAFSARVAAAAGDGTMDDRLRNFTGQLAARLEGAASEFKTSVIDTDRTPTGGAIARVSVNDRTEGRFLLDTGAMIVTLSEAFAQRLSLDLSDAPETELILANGDRVRARRVLLTAMQLGDARVEAVEAVVLPAPPGDGVDGLLGMSFLRHFIVELDGASGRLRLGRFAPE